MKRWWLNILLGCVALLLAAGAWFSFFIRHLTPEGLIRSPIVQQIVKRQAGEAGDDLLRFAPEFLGFSSPRTYLVLFENNTELRPAGGFIGAYAAVRLDKGQMSIIELEGTEVLDKKTPSDWKPAPPKPITEHLKVDRWYFRDSNWSPDFSESAKQALTFYRAEGGAAASDIDAVIALTPTVLEEVVRQIGPVTVQGMTFTADNVIEKLEYEVEYGFDDRGIPVHDRKQILEPFARTIMSRLERDAFLHSGTYLYLARRLLDERHILAYSPHEAWTATIRRLGASGELIQTEGDYVLWVDANLAALKTDHAMQRTLAYAIQKNAAGSYEATATMSYRHEGRFDWRTTRYRTYARVYAPLGARFVSARVDGVAAPPLSVAQGEERGKTWFGTFISIEPGKTKTLSFSYLLPPRIHDGITNGRYAFVAQKQLGTLAHGLTLNLDFGIPIQSAEPAETEREWGDAVYRLTTDLRQDREFIVTF